jgi:hypothetical protein
MRVDMSGETYEVLLDTPYWNRTFYAGWQILFFAEISRTGWRGYSNFLDDDVWKRTMIHWADDGPFPHDDVRMSMEFAGFHAVRDLRKYEPALKALCRFGEEIVTLMHKVTGLSNERRLLTQEESEAYRAARLACAQHAVAAEGVEIADLIELTKILCAR